MEINKLKDVIKQILDRTQPTQNIIQNLSKVEIDEVAGCLEEIGYKLLQQTVLAKTEELSKAVNYQIPGVKSKGFVPEDHPERALVVDHINRLMTLPNDHPRKGIATAVARALQEKHLQVPSAPITPAVQAQPAAPKSENPPMNYSKINAITPKEPWSTVNYSQKEPVTTVHTKVAPAPKV